MYKVIVAGGRSFDNYSFLEERVKRHLKGMRPSQIEIVSGTARGADQLGEHFARQWGCHLKQFPADWNQFGKAAGPIRNRRMGEYANAAVIFWDGASRGTKSMIDIAKDLGLELEIIMYEKSKSVV